MNPLGHFLICWDLGMFSDLGICTSLKVIFIKTQVQCPAGPENLSTSLCTWQLFLPFLFPSE